MFHLHARHILFVFVTGYLLSCSYLLLSTLIESRHDHISDFAPLWFSTPLLATLVCLLLAFLWLPLGIIYAALLLVIMRVRIALLRPLLSAIAGVGLAWAVVTLLPFASPETTSSVLRYAAIDFVAIGWLAMLIYMFGRARTATIPPSAHLPVQPIRDEAV